MINLKIRFSLAFSILVFAAVGFAFGQKQEYKIRAKGGKIIVSYKSKAHALDLKDAIDAAKITETEILFAARRAGFIYLVIDVSGQSKVKQDNRQCGAGTEANLIWIKLDAAWKVVDSRSVRYESCWSSVSNDNYKKTNNSMYIEIDNFRDDVSIKLAYNADEPEKGFQITEQPLKEPE